MLKVLSFWLADELYGVEIAKVKEINRNVEYSMVPKTNENIVGLFNMRGQIVTLFNLARVLGFQTQPGNGRTTCIILKSEPGSPNQKGFIIDKAGDVIDLDENMCEDPPANMGLDEFKCVKKVARLDRELLRIVETDMLFNETTH